MFFRNFVEVFFAEIFVEKLRQIFCGNDFAENLGRNKIQKNLFKKKERISFEDVWKSIEKEKIRSLGACRCSRGACRRRRRSRRRPARISPRGSLPCVLLLTPRSSSPGAGRRSPRDELAAGSGLLQPRGAHRRAALLLPMGAGRARPPRRGSTIATGSTE
jgi:hypothetical protein